MGRQPRTEGRRRGHPRDDGGRDRVMGAEIEGAETAETSISDSWPPEP